jgi:hypothetical protein
VTTDIAPDFEALLRQALRPIDPPEGLADRLETTLTNLHGLAFEELEKWELSAMRDPRNWVRPVAAAVVGAGAGTALVIVRTRQRARKRKPSANPLDAIERTLGDLATEARRLLDS